MSEQPKLIFEYFKTDVNMAFVNMALLTKVCTGNNWVVTGII